MKSKDKRGNSRKVTNIGEYGRRSIRIGDTRIEDLPMVPSAHAKHQMPLVEDGERKQKIAGVLAKYPKHSPAYLASRVKECQENIVRIATFKGTQNQMIEEYTGQISMCKHRDREIAKLNSEQDKAAIKALKVTFPPYNVKAMEQQIVQCREALERSDNVIEQEQNSISEFQEVQLLIRMRDQELQNLGVKQAV